MTASHLRTGLAALFTSTLLLVPAVAGAAADPKAVVAHYVDLGRAKFEDTVTTAKVLDAAIDALLAKPSDETLKAAREAWIAARVPYQQTEVYRFGNPEVDEFEGKVNAWPLDEGLIDYVDESYGSESDENALFVANVVANKSLQLNGETIDASTITPELLADKLHAAGDVDANVATGYHAIEFLLWGQDLNGNGPGAGNRPASDYDAANCTHGNCDRRAAYLKAASTLLVQDLDAMLASFQPDGALAKRLAEADPKTGLSTILTGMGSLSYGELAGERMKLGLMLHDPEEEQDCFSDNTQASHLNDAIGIAGAYTGRYTRIDGTDMTGPSLSELVAEKDPALDTEVKGKLEATLSAMQVMAERARATEAYDQMIGEGNTEGNAIVQKAVDGLIDQTRSIERVITALDLGKIALEGSDSLDNPSAVQP